MNRRPDPFAKINTRLTENVKTLSQIATEAIEGMIADGSLRSGERINESHLAEHLGISRGPIREACKKLEQAGLLHNVKNHGVFIRVLSVEDTRHLYELRSALAAVSGRLIALWATDAAIAELVAMVNKMDETIEVRQPESNFSLNLEFHVLLNRATGNPTLEETDEAIANQLFLAWPEDRWKPTKSASRTPNIG